MFRHRQVQDYSEDELHWHLHKRLRALRDLQAGHLRRSGKIFSARLQQPAKVAGRPAGNMEGDDRPKPPDGSRNHRFLPLMTLTIMEAGLIASLMIMIISGLLSLEKSNQIARQTWQLPVVTATPLVRPLRLPSGSALPNVAAEDTREILVHGFSLLQRKVPVVNISPALAVEFATRIQIPAIGVDAPIVQGIESEQLKKGVGQVPGTVNPGQKGNLVLSAHNDIYGELFRYLDRLQSGDQFTVFTNLRAYTYIITGSELVEPERVKVLEPTPEATATLISCYPYLIDTLRIVVKARLVEG